MTDFFDDMASMVYDLLAPSDQGGPGAVGVKYIRYTPAATPVNPWEPPAAPTATVIPIRAQAFGISKELVGTAIEGNVLVATDEYVISERIPGGYQVGDVIELDGVPVTILSVRRFPVAGVHSAVKFIVRR